MPENAVTAASKYPVLGGKPCRFTVSILIAAENDTGSEWRRLAGFHTQEHASAYAEHCVERDGYRALISDWETAQCELLIPEAEVQHNDGSPDA